MFLEHQLSSQLFVAAWNALQTRAAVYFLSLHAKWDMSNAQRFETGMSFQLTCGGVHMYSGSVAGRNEMAALSRGAAVL